MPEPWTQDEIDKAVKLYAKGEQIKKIADKINRSFHATAQKLLRKATEESKEGRRKVFAARLTLEQIRKNKAQEVKDKIEQKRMDCYINGDTDADAAVKCGIATNTYTGWRINRSLPRNIIEKTIGEEYDLKRYDLTSANDKRRAFKAEDIVYYHRNNNAPPAEQRPSEIRIIIPASEKPLLPPVANMSDQGRIEARRMYRDAERKNYTVRDETNNLAYIKACNV